MNRIPRKPSLRTFRYGRLFYVPLLWLGFVCFFQLQKAVFLQINAANRLHGLSGRELLEVFTNGFVLDSSVAAYLCVLPCLYLLLRPRLRFSIRAERTLGTIYFVLVGLLTGLLYGGDTVLYPYWETRLDATPLFYLRNPQSAGASATVGDVLIFCVQLLCSIAIVYFGSRALRYLCLKGESEKKSLRLVVSTALLFVCAPLLFLAIRGSVSVSTANPGMVSFSKNKFLNDAANNPAFNFFYSLTHEDDFATRYHRIDPALCKQLFAEIMARDEANEAGTPELLDASVEHPNVIVILMESFSANAIGACGASPSATPFIDSLASSSILFERCYASTFRTDRGIPASLSGMPAPPTTSLLKIPNKASALPSLARTFAQRGYHTKFLYGGDASFTNMKGYLYNTGYKEVADLSAFPKELGESKWGVPDAHTFDYLLQDCNVKAQRGVPFFYTFLTLSSHEPFDVPTKRFDHPYLNSIAYTDSCLGKFISAYQKTPAWRNTLIVLVSDHGYPHPDGIEAYDPKRFAMLMMWSGGVVAHPTRVGAITSPVNLPATLLHQLRIPHDQFVFSVNTLDPATPKFAFYTFPDLYGWIDKSGATVRDNVSDKVLYNQGEDSSQRIRNGEVFLQTFYDYVANLK